MSITPPDLYQIPRKQNIYKMERLIFFMVSWIRKIGRKLFGLRTIDENPDGRNGRPRIDPIRSAFKIVKHESLKKDFRINRIFSRLNNHKIILETHGHSIDKLKKEIELLKRALESVHEQGLRQDSRLRPINQPISRLNPINRSVEAGLKLSAFSVQEKKIIAVMFEHKGMALSYQDIAKLLDKSPLTIKSQINQLRTKTNLLVGQSDSEGKKRFGLKENARIESFVAGD